jgi:hypothetical protein
MDQNSVNSFQRNHIARTHPGHRTQSTQFFSSPFLRLPTEVLEHIFLLVRNDAVTLRVDDKNTHEDRIHQRAEGPRYAAYREKPLSHRTRLAWMALSQVCRDLRGIALGYGLLWTDIDMELDLRCVDEFVARAGTHVPLLVDGRFWRCKPTSDDHRQWHTRDPSFIRALAQLAELYPRAAEFAVQGLSVGELRGVLAALEIPAPSLRHLIICAAPAYDDSNSAALALPSSFLARVAPTLTRITLRGLRFGLVPAPAFAHLRQLVLECVTLYTDSHQGNDADNGAFVPRPKLQVSHLCAWLGGMPMLESIALHGLINLANPPADYIAGAVVALPRLTELRVTAQINVLLALLGGLPAPRDLLACTFTQMAGPDQLDLEHTQLLIERLLGHARSFYADAPPADEHFPWLDTRNGVGALQVSRPGKTLVLACADDVDSLETFCQEMLPLHEVPRIGIVLGAKSAIHSAIDYLPDYAFMPELVVHAATAIVEDDTFDAGESLLPALEKLRIVGGEAAFFESQRLAWWLGKRASMGTAQIQTLVLQNCYVRAPAPRWVGSALAQLVDDVQWISGEYSPRLEIDSPLRTKMFLNQL